MSIESFIRKICVQTAVYWGNPVPDGFGGMTYDIPVEIKVRWDENIKVVVDKEGKEITSPVTILSPEDLVEQGRLMLGTLEDVDFEWIPTDIEENTFEIVAREKISMIKSLTQFVRTYYLQ